MLDTPPEVCYTFDRMMTHTVRLIVDSDNDNPCGPRGRPTV